MTNNIFKSNFEINRKENCITISINPKIFPLDVIYSAAYVFLDKAYIIVDGDPKVEILIELRPKTKNIDLELLAREFNNELLNYSVYKQQAEKNAPIREAIIQRALLTNDSNLLEGETDESYLDDPEGIAVPWEEKFGKKEVSDAKSSGRQKK